MGPWLVPKRPGRRAPDVVSFSGTNPPRGKGPCHWGLRTVGVCDAPVPSWSGLDEPDP